MKNYYFCTWIRVPNNKNREVCICCKSKAQLSALFQSKICNSLILNAVFVLLWKM